jgi:hypothetical protein
MGMKTGQKKYDARFGWGVVREVTDKSVKVQFAIDVCEYTLEGKDQAHQLVVMLSDEKYHMLTKEDIINLYLKGMKGTFSQSLKSWNEAEEWYKQNYGL